MVKVRFPREKRNKGRLGLGWWLGFLFRTGMEAVEQSPESTQPQTHAMLRIRVRVKVRFTKEKRNKGR